MLQQLAYTDETRECLDGPLAWPPDIQPRQPFPLPLPSPFTSPRRPASFLSSISPAIPVRRAYTYVYARTYERCAENRALHLARSARSIAAAVAVAAVGCTLRHICKSSDERARARYTPEFLLSLGWTDSGHDIRRIGTGEMSALRVTVIHASPLVVRLSRFARVPAFSLIFIRHLVYSYRDAR